MTTPSSPSPSAGRPSAAVIAAWQSALAAEHAAVFGYGTLGPRLPTTDRATAAADQAGHVTLRDATIAALRAAGADPVRSLATYPLPGVIASATAARRTALGLEEACAQAWRYVIAVAADDAATTTAITAIRAAAVIALTASAVRAVGWRAVLVPTAPSVPFPGI